MPSFQSEQLHVDKLSGFNGLAAPREKRAQGCLVPCRCHVFTPKILKNPLCPKHSSTISFGSWFCWGCGFLSWPLVGFFSFSVRNLASVKPGLFSPANSVWFLLHWWIACIEATSSAVGIGSWCVCLIQGSQQPHKILVHMECWAPKNLRISS